jgi:thiol-disulfide isomerase/thioredoxin
MNNYTKKYYKYKNKYNLLKQTAGYKNPQLITFTAEWCGHCQRFQPVLNELKNNSKLKVDFINYDSEKDKNIINEYKIQGYPTIMLNYKNKLIEYQGNRDEQSIINFINSYTKKL